MTGPAREVMEAYNIFVHPTRNVASLMLLDASRRSVELLPRGRSDAALSGPIALERFAVAYDHAMRSTPSLLARFD